MTTIRIRESLDRRNPDDPTLDPIDILAKNNVNLKYYGIDRKFNENT